MKKIIIITAYIFAFISFIHAEYIIKKNNFIAHYNNFRQLYRIDFDKNNDGKIDLIKFIKNGKVYKILKDENNDYYFETKIFLKNGKLSKVEKDLNKDNRTDKIYIYKNNALYKVKEDKDFDGKFEIIKYYKSNRLMKEIKGDKTIEYKEKGKIVVKNKKGDVFYYTNGMITKAILNNGERIILYKKGKKFIEKIDKDKDGFYEIVIKGNKRFFYQKSCNFPIRIEKNLEIFIDKNCNRIFEKIKKKNEILLDGNEDGFPEKVWILKPKIFKQDRNYDKKYDYFVYYSNGKIKKIEIDSNFDGNVDIWKYFKNGKLIKVKKDLNFDGKIDFEE